MRIIGAALGPAFLWLPLCAPGSAQADAAQANFVNQLEAHGIPEPSDQMLNNGYVMCKALNSHEDADTVIGRSVPITALSAVQTAYEVGVSKRSRGSLGSRGLGVTSLCGLPCSRPREEILCESETANEAEPRELKPN